MLSGPLFAEISPDFFRILTSVNARIYIDALDALAREMGEISLGISRQEATEIVREVLQFHASAKLEEELEAETTPGGVPAFLLNRLIERGWLSEPQRPDYQRILYLERAGEILLDALRRIASPDAAQFTDHLQIVCTTLMSPEGFKDNPWGDLEACVKNARFGLQELRGMQKSVERYTKRQLNVETLRENLSVLYDEFSEAIGHSCYRELVRARLPVRLKQARRKLEEIERAGGVLEEMQRELQRRHPDLDPAEAMSRVRNRVHELFELLDAIEPQAETIDRRTAEFARRSFARFRYLQEVTGARREEVQTLFEQINHACAGKRMSDIALDLPALLIPEVKLIGGIESLFTPRKRRSAEAAQPIDEDPDSQEAEEALLEMEANLRDSLTAIRANKFIEELVFGTDGTLHSSDLPIRTEDEIADVAALLLHAESSDAKYRVSTERDDAFATAAVAQDAKAGFLIERFVIKIAVPPLIRKP